MIRRMWPLTTRSLGLPAYTVYTTTRVRLWKLDSENTEQDYAFVCDTVIHTGHRANIFNAQMLPHSSRMYVNALA